MIRGLLLINVSELLYNLNMNGQASTNLIEWNYHSGGFYGIPAPLRKWFSS